MHTYRRLLGYARHQRSLFLLIFFLTVAASALVALQPWPMKLLVDHVLKGEPRPEWLSSLIAAARLPATNQALLLFVVGGGLLLFILNSLLDTVLTWSWPAAGRRVVYGLAEGLFARLQRRSLLFPSRNSVGDTMSRITGDCWAVHKVIDELLFTPAHALLTIAVMVFLMSRLDGTLTWIALVTAPLMVAASMLLGKPLRAAAKLKRELESRIQSHIQQ